MRCESCDIELQPKGAGPAGRYCCEGCADGGPCVCAYEGNESSSQDSNSGRISLLELLETYAREVEAM
jgi:hypothetical protein